MIVLHPNTKVEGGVEYKNKKNCFQIFTEHRTYAMTTRTETELWWWVGLLKEIVDPGNIALSIPRLAVVAELG